MFGGKDDELATRWLQLGVFSPISRLHSGLSPFNSKEPWRFGAAAQAVMTDFLRLRHRLLPYLHTMNHRAARDGSPLVQPMYWSHPEDAEAYEVPNQFMFGTAVAGRPDHHSRRQHACSWPVCGPGCPPAPGSMSSSGLMYVGGRQIVLHRDLTQLPVLARAGAIIPMAAARVPGNGPDNPAALEVSGGGRGRRQVRTDRRRRLGFWVGAGHPWRAQ